MRRKKFLLLTLILAALISYHPADAQEPTPGAPPTPAEVINAVNNLRIAHGLSALMVHPALMQIAQMQADGIASGSSGHWRPDGLTLGQWLLTMGYPLSGDLSMDGYRSENWITAMTADQAIQGWLSDDEHENTMLSVDRSDIGAGIAVSDQIYVVIETALQTASGQMQYDASAILTGIPQTQIAYSGMATQAAENGLLPQYSMPVAVNTAQPNGDVYHKVEYGQSLWSIAITYHTTIRQIQLLNNLYTTTINVGQKLLVLKGATQPAPTFNGTGTPAAQIILTTPPPTLWQTPTPTEIHISPRERQANMLSLIGIGIAALVLGGVFTMMTRKRG